MSADRPAQPSHPDFSGPTEGYRYPGGSPDPRGAEWGPAGGSTGYGDGYGDGYGGGHGEYLPGGAEVNIAGPHGAEPRGAQQGADPRGPEPRSAHGSGPGRGAPGRTPSNRSGQSANNGRSASSVAQIAMAVLFVLAVIATIVMVFSDNDLWMRIGLLAALWSALVGALLVARDRRAAQQAAEREVELKRVHSLELESEVAARRESELTMREELRDEVRAEHDDSLESLRVEVVALRSQLEQLGVQPIVDGSRSVDAGRRAQELAGAAGTAGAAGAAGTEELGGSSRSAGFPYGVDHRAGTGRGPGYDEDARSYGGSQGESRPDDAYGRPAAVYVAGADSPDATPSTEVTSSMPKVREGRDTPPQWSGAGDTRRSPFPVSGYGSTPATSGASPYAEPAEPAAWAPARDEQAATVAESYGASGYGTSAGSGYGAGRAADPYAAQEASPAESPFDAVMGATHSATEPTAEPIAEDDNGLDYSSAARWNEPAYESSYEPAGTAPNPEPEPVREFGQQEWSQAPASDRSASHAANPAAEAATGPATGPGTDRFRSFESFHLSAPPNFADESELPDFDAPTGFELGTGARTGTGAAAAPTAGWGVAPAPSDADDNDALSDPFASSGWGTQALGDSTFESAARSPEAPAGGRHGGSHEAAGDVSSSFAPAAEPRPGRRRKPEPESSPDSLPESAPTEATDEPRRGRRRKPDPEESGAAWDATSAATAGEVSPSSQARGARSRHESAEGTSVADLLARFGDGSAHTEGGGRRRRDD